MIEGNFIITALISIAIWLIYRLYNSVKNKKVNIFREIVLSVFFIYFLFLLLLTIFKYGIITLSNPFNSYMYREHGLLGIINIVPIKETINTFMYSETGLINSIRNIIGNILVFIPIGFFIPLLFDKFNSYKKILKVGFLSSLAIEITQLFIGSNVCDIDDVIYNTIGALAGLICYKIFEMIIVKINLKDKVDKIRDFKTNNIFKKLTKGILIVTIVISAGYIYSFYNQTISAELSDMEIGQKIFKCEKENIVDIKEFNDDKFYLIKDDLGANVTQVSKYMLGRYINKINYSYIENGEYGYRQELICDNIYENKISPIVYGKNTDASKVIITLKDKTYERDIKENDYFMVIYPEMISFDEAELNQIYSNEKSNIISVKFVNDDGEEIETLSDLDKISE